MSMDIAKLLQDQALELNVLYVEDEEIIRTPTAKMFSNFFNKVDTAEDGAEGLKQYIDFHETTGSHYDLVISDINMPNMDGTEMSREILSLNPTQKVLIISAHNDSQRLLDLINISIRYFVMKPIIYEQMVQILFDICRDINDAKLLERYYNDIEELSTDLYEKNRHLTTTIRFYEKEIKLLKEEHERSIGNGNKVDSAEIKSTKSIKMDTSLKKDIRFNQNDKMDALSFVTTLDDSAIDKVESFLHELDRLVLEIYNMEDSDMDNRTESVNVIVDVFRIFTDTIDALGAFPVTVRAFVALSDLLATLNLSFFDDKSKKKLFITVLLGISNDLEAWINSIFIDNTANDIHYFDSSFANNCLEIEAMFSESEIESDDDDLEFF